MRFHWQNLNERRRGADGCESRGPPWYGRAWLGSFGFEWCLGRRATWGISVGRGEEKWTLMIGVPLAVMFLTFETFSAKPERELSLKFHDGGVWWSVWSPSKEWPRWRDGSFHPLDWALGQRRLDDRPLEYRWVEVPMPERVYYGCAALYEATHRRPRWFARRFLRYEIEMLPDEQVPIPGKGENAWDCGEDAFFSSSGSAKSISDAIGDFVGSCLARRERYGGQDWRPAAHKLRSVA